MQKLKARDVVAGWPRGRSTLGPAKFCDLPWSLFLLVERFRANPMNNIEAAVEHVNELKFAIDYHAEQQRMVTAWLERHRRPPADSKMHQFSVSELECLQQLRIRPLAGL